MKEKGSEVVQSHFLHVLCRGGVKVKGHVVTSSCEVGDCRRIIQITPCSDVSQCQTSYTRLLTDFSTMLLIKDEKW